MHRRIIVIALILIAAAIGIYVAIPRTPQPQPLRLEQDVKNAKFTSVDPPRPAPAAQFTTLAGKTEHFADFQGRWLLINLWATWCAPCLTEMPSLDRMQAKLGDRLAVIAISEDRTGKEAVEPFLVPLQITTLAIAVDPPGLMASTLDVQGLPTSFLIDPKGRIVAKLEGAAEWDHALTIKALDDLMAAKVN